MARRGRCLCRNRQGGTGGFADCDRPDRSSDRTMNAPMEGLPRSQTLALNWLDERRRVVVASLIETLGSAPLDAGAEMLVDDANRIEGSVTGGCVEAALVQEAQEILQGAPPHALRYGISDQEAADVGLMCGGTVEVFLHELTEEHRDVLTAVRDARDDGRPVVLATLLDGDHAGSSMAVLEDSTVGTLDGPQLLDAAVTRDARGFLAEGRSAIRRYSARGEVMGSDLRVHIQAFATPPQMLIFGAIDFSAALAPLAAGIGYQVTICDARAAFASSPRFSRHADVVIDWPDRHLAQRTLGPRDVILVFTHDPKFDEPALTAALESEAGYIGALGSRRTHTDRVARLRAAGTDEPALGRINSPCGLDVGARTPSETAIAILAEILALRAGRDGGRLKHGTAPIHPRTADVA
ncbi:MAG: XdhC/CoxI family protein [Solirubrobacterales bacterium]